MSTSIRSLLSYLGAGSLLRQIPLNKPHVVTSLPSYAPFSDAPSCPSDSPTSCHNGTSVGDSCCFVAPGGQLLLTQFWDTSPAIGPADSFTLHGLWPDLCDGTYDQYCTFTPKYFNITSILQDAGQDELLAYMQSYWLPDRGSTEYFWEHEYNKHSTCINTLAPSCYGDSYTSGIEVVDFFTRAVELFKMLDSYKALAAAGILPSSTITYSNAEIQEALTAVTGNEVVLGCNRGALNQVWYSFNIAGNLQTGEFKASPPVGKSGRGSCPTTGIKYVPKE